MAFSSSYSNSAILLSSPPTLTPDIMKLLTFFLAFSLIAFASSAQEGCTDPTACNYDDTAIDDNGTCCFDNCIHIAVTDALGVSDITWEISDEDGNVIVSGGIPFDEFLCLEAGCYTTTIYDTNGDDPNVITIYAEDGDGTVLIDQEFIVNLGFDISIPWCIDDYCTGPDFTCDFSVDTMDLLILLSGFGCEGEDCVCDINGDDLANTIDVLLFLEAYQ
jgi:hypothetical protein